MCLSIPKCVVEWVGDGDLAWVERDGRRERINMLLVGPQAPGTWVLTSLGMAREVLADDQRLLIEDALAALAATLDGNYDADLHFADLQPGRHD